MKNPELRLRIENLRLFLKIKKGEYVNTLLHDTQADNLTYLRAQLVELAKELDELEQGCAAQRTANRAFSE